MGSSIAQLAAQSGIMTLLYDVNPGMINQARTNLENNLVVLIKKSKITEEEKARILQRMNFTSNIDDCLADVFIEAIIEDPAVKIGLFNQLAEINHSESIFASNTSSLSITGIASQVRNPERVIGMHFFNPATIMKLVEVVNTNYTNENTTQIIVDLAKQMKKTPVVCKDSPGFIVNRVARPYYIESLRLAEEGVIDFVQLDRIMEASGFKMGPFKLMDLIGNDVNYSVSCSVYEQLDKPERLKPSPIQKQKVNNGELGKKSGKGYYNYHESPDN